MTGDEIGTWKVAASRIEAALLIQPGWDVRFVDGESGEAIRFERTSAEYSETWTEADGAACCGGLVGTVSFSPKVVRDDFLALKSTQEKLAFFGKVNSERGQRFCNESCAGKARVARSRKKRPAAARATGSVAS